MEQLRLKIKDKLKKRGFTCSENSEWVKSTQQTIGGGTIIVNGKQMQQPGKVVNIKMIYEDLGDCIITDIATNIETNSMLCAFKLQQENELVQDFEINLYPDDYKVFNDLMTKIFKIC